MKFEVAKNITLREFAKIFVIVGLAMYIFSLVSERSILIAIAFGIIALLCDKEKRS